MGDESHRSSFLINSGRNGGISSGSKLSAKIRYGAPESLSDLLMVLDDKIDDNGTFTAGTPVKYERERTAGVTKAS